jgi:uncharacterized protein (TIGR02145 family)
MKEIFAFLVIMCPMIAFSQNVEVQGSVKIVDGTQGINKVLTSDADGLASWQSPTPETKYYQSVNICCDSWMTKNLDVDHYRNGDPIPKVEDAAEWATLTTGGYCYYNNDSTTYAAIYGKLYNWYAVNDPRGLAPEGWEVPTDFVWTNAEECLGGSATAGGLMKEIGTTQWLSPNEGATNLSGFAGLPGGLRLDDGTFNLNLTGFSGNWWSSTEDVNNENALMRYLLSNESRSNSFVMLKSRGLSVRCIRD